MAKQVEMTEEKAFEQDVTTMSYEELMESIRFLDKERKRLSGHINDLHDDKHDDVKEETILKRVA